MTKEDLCRIICECLEREGTFPGRCSNQSTVPTLDRDGRQRVAACIVLKVEERGCEIPVNPDHIEAGRTVKEVCDVLVLRLVC